MIRLPALALALAVVLCLAACSALPMACRDAAYPRTVYVVADGWHADLGIPVDELGPRLGFLRAKFPGAKVLIFGYGKRTFIAAPARSWREYALGPVPGPAIVQVFGLSAPPAAAYDPQDVRALSLSSEGLSALTDRVWGEFTKSADGQPVELGPSVRPPGLFFAARSMYSFHHTCNTWVAEALRAGQVPLDNGEGAGEVVFAGQLLARVDPVAARQCSASKGP